MNMNKGEAATAFKAHIKQPSSFARVIVLPRRFERRVEQTSPLSGFTSGFGALLGLQRCVIPFH
jgi:hypothetical protein